MSVDPPSEAREDPRAAAERRVGTTVAGKWRLDRVLGAGGMATVYAATHLNNLRTIAIKILHPELATSPDIVRRFQREGYIANKVGHPGAVAILDDGSDEDGNAFLVMELLHGESLGDKREAAGGTLPAQGVLRVVDAVLDVLVAAHEQGIVHRDLKPDNVFLTKDGAVKVLDFGIARLLDPPNGEVITQAGVMMGTPVYMPPEQARGRSSEIDARSDLWALGAILFACITGRYVHESETPQEALLRAMSAHAVSIKTVVPDLDPKVAAVVDRALKFHPDDRWQDAKSMQAGVREALASLAGERAPASAAVASAAPFASPPSSNATKMPIVAELPPRRASRGSGARVLVVVTVLGGLAAGLAWLVRERPRATAASFDPPVVTAPAPAPSSHAAVAHRSPGGTLTILTPADADVDAEADAGARADAEPAPDSGAIALADAAADGDTDADEEDYDDDAGEEEDEIVDAAPLAKTEAPAAVAHAAPRVAPKRPPAPPAKKAKPHKKKR
jgi:serine/threonine-protein kinase